MKFSQNLITLIIYFLFINFSQSKETNNIHTNNSDIWSGNVGVTEHSSNPKYISGDFKEKNILIEIDISFIRRATLDEDYHLTTKHGTGFFIDKGTSLFAVKSPVYDHEGRLVSDEDEIRWCLIRNKNNKGKPIKTSTYCILRGKDEITYFIKPFITFKYTVEMLNTRKAIKSSMPVFSEKDVKLTPQLSKKLFVRDISKNEFILQWMIEDNSEKSYHLWGNTLYKYVWKDRKEIKITNEYGSFLVKKIDKKNINITWLSKNKPQNKTASKLEKILNFEVY